jgi:hypothetical protein
MANYAETLAYWYLRLNGFFPINQFVLHDNNADRGPAPDCDLLAIRFPHTHETVGDGHLDHEMLLNPIWGDRNQNGNPDDRFHIIGVIVEAKGGGQETPRNAFNNERVLNSVKRLGFFQFDANGGECEATRFATNLHLNWKHSNERFIAAKLFFAEHPLLDNNAYHAIPLSNTRRFIRERMAMYRQPKERDWHLFSSDLIQHLIWDRDVEGQ